jgi:hypothetical protein
MRVPIEVSRMMAVRSGKRLQSIVSVDLIFAFRGVFYKVM